MATRLSVLAVLGALLAGPAAAQDAQRVLRAASDAMGAPSNVRYSGTGWVANVGQSYTPDDDWPRFEVASYTRTISYDDRSSREEYTRRQGNYPPQGGGAPLPTARLPHERRLQLEPERPHPRSPTTLPHERRLQLEPERPHWLRQRSDNSTSGCRRTDF